MQNYKDTIQKLVTAALEDETLAPKAELVKDIDPITMLTYGSDTLALYADLVKAACSHLEIRYLAYDARSAIKDMFHAQKVAAGMLLH